mmetsp:Transcript_3339/g.5194  ORF Transcript_3339/g.5194 Transcript_3339/m.5194 type:complete len:251 (-) Transcript_3339:151-903(-)
MGNQPGKNDDNFPQNSEPKNGKNRAYSAPLSHSDTLININILSLEQFDKNDPNNCDIFALDKEDVVPTVFRWDKGGKTAFIAGSFNDWGDKIPMHRSGNDFTYIHALSREKHTFKFFVDGEWRYAPDQPFVEAKDGDIINTIDVSNFIPYTGDDGDFGASKIDKKEFSQEPPDFDEYGKDPPPLPPQLRHVVLNKAPSSLDSRELMQPSNVALNHLYCTTMKDGIAVLGMSIRYRQKFGTTIYYRTSVMP